MNWRSRTFPLVDNPQLASEHSDNGGTYTISIWKRVGVRARYTLYRKYLGVIHSKWFGTVRRRIELHNLSELHQMSKGKFRLLFRRVKLRSKEMSVSESTALQHDDVAPFDFDRPIKSLQMDPQAVFPYTDHYSTVATMQSLQYFDVLPLCDAEER